MNRASVAATFMSNRRSLADANMIAEYEDGFILYLGIDHEQAANLEGELAGFASSVLGLEIFSVEMGSDNNGFVYAFIISGIDEDCIALCLIKQGVELQGMGKQECPGWEISRAIGSMAQMDGA